MVVMVMMATRAIAVINESVTRCFFQERVLDAHILFIHLLGSMRRVCTDATLVQIQSLS